MALSIRDIQYWLRSHQARLKFGDPVPPLTEVACRAGLSRQTLYAVLNGEREEFGQIAQIRLSRVISQISSDPNYQHSKVARINFTSAVPSIRFGL